MWFRNFTNGRAATLLAALSMLLLMGSLVVITQDASAAAQQGACPDGTEQYVVNVDDGPSSPRDELQAWVEANYGNKPSHWTRDFGEPGNDKYFTHTLEIPDDVQIFSGSIELNIKSGGSNDQLHVGDIGTTPSAGRWGDSLKDLGINVNQTKTLNLDLTNLDGNGTSLLSEVSQLGYIDIAVQDDSTVDYVEITLCIADFGSCPDGAEKLVVRADTGPSDPRTELQEWVEDNYGNKPSHWTRDFGETGNDKYFAHTLDLPSDVQIIAGYLEVDVRLGGSNDQIHIGDLGEAPSAGRWGDALEDLGVGSSPKRLEFVLSNMPGNSNNPDDLLPSTLSLGYLDVIVQDDSPVQHLELTLCVLPLGYCLNGDPAPSVLSLGSDAISQSGSYRNSYPGENAFNGNSDAWISKLNQVPATLGVELDRGATTVTAYEISFANGSLTGRAPNTWTFEGRNNGGNWAQLDQRANEASWAGTETRTYAVMSPGSYGEYRLVVTKDNDNRRAIVVVSIAELDLLGAC